MIVHEKEEVVHDHVDEVLKEAIVRDLPDARQIGDVFPPAAEALAEELGSNPFEIERLLWERERQSSTALSEFVAVPHLVVRKSGAFKLLCIRTSAGVSFSETYPRIRAVFVLAGASDKRALHLHTLAALAQIVMDSSFEAQWMTARKPEQLREVLLLGERRRHSA
jgi:mannitol/fructose-specific phosphotransferase system IIA component (Ntr-type)